MIRTGAVVATLALLGACASPERPWGSSRVTLFGSGAPLEEWKTSVVEGVHVHAGHPQEPCPAASISEMLSQSRDMLVKTRAELDEPLTKLTASTDSFLEGLFASSLGRAVGGATRMVVALQHPGPDGAPDQTLLLDLPRLRPDELERRIEAREIQGSLDRPPGTPVARLEGGWVRVTRSGPDRLEFDLFLVLRAVQPDAGFDQIQVVTRVEGPAR